MSRLLVVVRSQQGPRQLAMPVRHSCVGLRTSAVRSSGGSSRRVRFCAAPPRLVGSCSAELPIA